MTKPTVYFNKIIGTLDTFSGFVYLLDEIYDHPLLGNNNGVRTSAVQNVTRSPDGEVIAFETRNTIYVQRQLK